MGRDVSSRVYPDSGVKNQFHNCSHHGENPKNIAEFARLNQYHISTVAPLPTHSPRTTGSWLSVQVTTMSESAIAVCAVGAISKFVSPITLHG